MKPKLHKIIEMCVESGIERGWNQSHKHLDNPNPEVVKETICDKIMEELYEYFIFDDEFV